MEQLVAEDIDVKSMYQGLVGKDVKAEVTRSWEAVKHVYSNEISSLSIVVEELRLVRSKRTTLYIPA